jgi:hypothetical protein
MKCATHPDRDATGYCRTCGKPLCPDCTRDVRGALYCEGCLAAMLSGAPVGAPLAEPAVGTPNPAVAAALGFIPGLGAIYNGEYLKGLIHVAVFAGIISVLSSISSSDSSSSVALGAFFGIGLGCFYLYMPIEAYRTAKMKRALAYGAYAAPAAATAGMPAGTVAFTGPAEAPYAGAPAPGPGQPPAQVQQGPLKSSMTGAVVLIAIGVLILLANLGLLSGDWLGHWWPLILIGLGVWLFWKRFHQPAGDGSQKP